MVNKNEAPWWALCTAKEFLKAGHDSNFEAIGMVEILWNDLCSIAYDRRNGEMTVSSKYLEKPVRRFPLAIGDAIRWAHRIINEYNWSIEKLKDNGFEFFLEVRKNKKPGCPWELVGEFHTKEEAIQADDDYFEFACMENAFDDSRIVTLKELLS